MATTGQCTKTQERSHDNLLDTPSQLWKTWKSQEFFNSGKLREFKIYSGNLSDVCIIVSKSTLNWLGGTVTGVDGASHHAP